MEQLRAKKGLYVSDELYGHGDRLLPGVKEFVN